MPERHAPVRNGGTTNVGWPLPLRDQPGTDPNHAEQPGQAQRPTPRRS